MHDESTPLDEATKNAIREHVASLLKSANWDKATITKAIEDHYGTQPQHRRFALNVLKIKLRERESSPDKPKERKWTRFEKDRDGTRTFTDIEYLGTSSTGADYFKVRTKDAMVTMFVKFPRDDESTRGALDIASVLREYRALNVLRDRNIVKVYDAAWIRTEDGEEFPFIATEFLTGVDLLKWREAYGKPPARQSAEIIRIIAATLQRLLNLPKKTVKKVLGESHVAEVMHLDLKPNNVMVLRRKDGRLGIVQRNNLKLIDFGSAGTAETGAAHANDHYKSPERFLSSDRRPPPNKTWDIFSLGALLYFLCTGHHLDSAKGQSKEEWNRYVSEIDLGTSDLSLICHKCLQFDSQDRYSTPGQLAEDLGDWLNHRPIRHVGRSYTWFEREGLLILRCRTNDDLNDVMRFGADVAVVLAILLALDFVSCSYLITHGMATGPNMTLDGYVISGAAGLLLIVSSVMVHFRWVAILQFLPLVALIFAIKFNEDFVQPAMLGHATGDETIRSYVATFPLLGLYNIMNGCYAAPSKRAKPGDFAPPWRIMLIVGCFVLLCTPIVAFLSRQPWFRDYTLLVAIAAEILGCVTFAVRGYMGNPKESSDTAVKSVSVTKTTPNAV